MKCSAWRIEPAKLMENNRTKIKEMPFKLALFTSFPFFCLHWTKYDKPWLHLRLLTRGREFSKMLAFPARGENWTCSKLCIGEAQLKTLEKTCRKKVNELNFSRQHTGLWRRPCETDYKCDFQRRWWCDIQSIESRLLKAVAKRCNIAVQHLLVQQSWNV